MHQMEKPYTLLDYVMILIVCVVFVVAGLCLRCMIIYNWFKEKRFVKEKAINT